MESRCRLLQNGRSTVSLKTNRYSFCIFRFITFAVGVVLIKALGDICSMCSDRTHIGGPQ